MVEEINEYDVSSSFEEGDNEKVTLNVVISSLLREATFKDYEEYEEFIEYLANLTSVLEYKEAIKILNNKVIDRITTGHYYNMSEINKHLKKIL